MRAFTVTSIIDGDTLGVNPQWKWNGETGTIFHPAEYDVPKLHIAKGQKAKDALSKLISAQQVEPMTAYKVDRSQLICELFVGSRSLAEFSPNIGDCLKLEP